MKKLMFVGAALLAAAAVMVFLLRAPEEAESSAADAPVEEWIPAPGEVRTLDWKDLLPADRREHYKPGPPAPAHDYLNPGGWNRFGGMHDEYSAQPAQGLAAQFDENSGMAARQTMDVEVDPTLDGVLVRLPGYIVPLEVAPGGVVTELFLAAYMGACIHVPPPPPNQMVYVRLPAHLRLNSVSDAYWFTGILRTHPRITGLAAAAYSMEIKRIDLHEE